MLAPPVSRQPLVVSRQPQPLHNTSSTGVWHLAAGGWRLAALSLLQPRFFHYSGPFLRLRPDVRDELLGCGRRDVDGLVLEALAYQRLVQGLVEVRAQLCEYRLRH